jgi:hypothetical protein
MHTIVQYYAPGDVLWVRPAIPAGGILRKTNVMAKGPGGGGGGGTASCDQGAGSSNIGNGGGEGGYVSADYAPGALPASVAIQVGSKGVKGVGGVAGPGPSGGVGGIGTDGSEATLFGPAGVGNYLTANPGTGGNPSNAGAGVGGIASATGLGAPANVIARTGGNGTQGIGGPDAPGADIVLPSLGGASGGGSYSSPVAAFRGGNGNDSAGGRGETNIFGGSALDGSVGQSGSGGGGVAADSVHYSGPLQAGSAGAALAKGAGGGGGGGAILFGAGFIITAGAGSDGGDGQIIVTTFYDIPIAPGFYPMQQLPVHQAVNMARPISITGRFKA